ncbi:ABC transporter substrate-binding protein [Jiangella anatolica]|uniref:Iron ABC transporter substrate-binding protein n=1 Tax=Jiangella anatolica TaxID=2670374 RepID=A0A2W2C6N8_9ACTN|nr:ABC transporter substrate-binding protein [Jiangella anatolica]PZF83819.1 iron ABC transporter substrate-binding protein [Jiangella anatolica]
MRSGTDAGRWRRLLLTMLVAVGLTVTACGADEPDDEPAAGTAAEGAFPVTVEHKFGETEIEAAPVRVVSVGYKEQDWLYEFGVSPVAVRQWYGVYDHEINPWAADLAEGDPPEVLGTELDIERVAELRPDLIVAVYSGITEEEYETLSQIAPTVAGPVGSTDYNEPWRDMTRLIGAALGQADRADEIIAEVEGLFAAAREEHPELVGAEVAAWSAWAADTIGMYSSGDPRSQLLAELGMQTPAAIDELAGSQFWAPVSPELVGDNLDLAGDAVVVIGGTSTEEEAGAANVISGNPTYANSRAGREGRVVFLDTAATDVAFSFASPLSIRFTLDHLVPQLVAALDGDPATEVPASPEE